MNSTKGALTDRGGAESNYASRKTADKKIDLDNRKLIDRRLDTLVGGLDKRESSPLPKSPIANVQSDEIPNVPSLLRKSSKSVKRDANTTDYATAATDEGQYQVIKKKPL